MMPPLSEILNEVIKQKAKDLVCLLVILAAVAFMVGSCVKVICEKPTRDYANVTEWAVRDR